MAVCGLLLASPLIAAEPKITPEQEQFFENKVRPILVEQCIKCHGPKKEMGSLRLDSAAAMLKGGETGPAVKPGDSEQSLLMRAVRRGGELKMPPSKPLLAESITVLETWVKMGAPWPASKSAGSDQAEAWKKHWAFQPAKNPPQPTVKNAAWPRTSIDHFILAALEAKELTPSAPAERRTLIRRAYIDLIGLPPSVEEVEAFVASTDSDAYPKLIDHLLSSPHYGERWGRYWLDVARYADSKGYVFFQDSKLPWAWTYRDYVIRAFNEDLPYDQFILQQLAADQLPLGADRRPLTALGFLTVGDRFSNNDHDILDDRIDVVARGLLGLTVTCARCHDHKFDPIPTADYYSLYGVFGSSVEPEVPPTFAEPERTELYVKFEHEMQERQAKLENFRKTKFDAMVLASKTRMADYLLKAHAMRGQPTTEEFMLLADPNDLNPTMVTRWRAYLDRTARQHHPVFAPWHAFAALPEKTFAERAKGLATAFGETNDSARPINPLVRKMIVEKPPQTLADLAARYAELLNGIEKRWQEAKQRAVEAKQLAPTALPDAAEEELRHVFHGPDSAPSATRAIFNDLMLLPDRGAQGELQKLRRSMEEWRDGGPGAPPRAMTLVDTPRPYNPHVFIRGNPTRPGPAVPRQFLALLAGPQRKVFSHGSGRLELARAIADRGNPLTARVMVNRIWLHHFGNGLVRTPSDFGMRSEPPTHPELLDHLATTFMNQGWSVKKMHRLIMLSATYQQTSAERGTRSAELSNAARPEFRAPNSVDPDNRLLWRMNRRRLDFEALRDAFLTVSNRIDRTVGGPAQGNLLGSSRRTVYGSVERLNLPGLFRTFDFPSPSASSAQRDQTTVPQQALFLMNNPFPIDCGRRLLQRPDIAGEKDLAKKVDRLYRLLYARPATAEEVALAQEYLSTDKKAGAWDLYAQALLLANEFAFVD
jgi:hypothetical protein